MSTFLENDECSRYWCVIDEAPFTTKDDSVFHADHSWGLDYTFAGIHLCGIKRRFKIRTRFNRSYSADFYASTKDGLSPCNFAASGHINHLFSERAEGFISHILYADLEHHFYIVRKQEELLYSNYKAQSPFRYIGAYGSKESVAYFIDIRNTVTVKYKIILRGDVLHEFYAGETVLTPYVQPIVWPPPESSASFFIGAPGYEWMVDDFFYWYNDPGDIGPFPCGSSQVSGLSPGLTGYTKALDDGGKDFFYPPWIRSSFFAGVDQVHRLWSDEAEMRFRNSLGAKDGNECAKPYERDHTFGLLVKQDIIGNYIKYADKDFYSFFLPEVNQQLNKLGNQEITDAFLEAVNGATTCYPIGIL